jgi:hypothetical protein
MLLLDLSGAASDCRERTTIMQHSVFSVVATRPFAWDSALSLPLPTQPRADAGLVERKSPEVGAAQTFTLALGQGRENTGHAELSHEAATFQEATNAFAARALATFRGGRLVARARALST